MMSDAREKFLEAEGETHRLASALRDLKREVETYKSHNEVLEGASQRLAKSSESLELFVVALQRQLDEVSKWRPKIHEQLAKQEIGLAELRARIKALLILTALAWIVVAVLVVAKW